MSNYKIETSNNLLMVFNVINEEILIIKNDNVKFLERTKNYYNKNAKELSVNKVFAFMQTTIDNTGDYIYGVIIKTNELPQVLSLHFKEEYLTNYSDLLSKNNLQILINKIYEVHSHTFYQGFIKNVKYLDNQITLI